MKKKNEKLSNFCKKHKKKMIVEFHEGSNCDCCQIEPYETAYCAICRKEKQAEEDKKSIWVCSQPEGHAMSVSKFSFKKGKRPKVGSWVYMNPVTGFPEELTSKVPVDMENRIIGKVVR